MTRTAQQQRTDEKVVFDAFMAACPTRQVLATVGDKWSTLIIVALAAGSQRHGELRKRIAGVSQKMLTQSLKSLERDGLITRTVTPSVPVRVDYELTALGRSLYPIVHELKLWSERNITAVIDARRAYEVAQPS